MAAPYKPTADELLLRLQDEERRGCRGRLKVFLGYASGVGKSFKTFDEGRRRRDRGQDVIVAAMQSHNSPELASLLQQLEIIPLREVNGVSVIDVDRVLQRQPEVCLIDGLAHDNPPGSKNPHRWQDVEQLLGAGISVITTINLEFIAERQEQVFAVTGKQARFEVPESFLYEAEELVVVDAPSRPRGDLPPAHLDASLPVTEKKLSQLREIALLLAADAVDSQLEAYLRRQGIETSWGTQERLLVCIGAQSPAGRMLERAKLAQQRFHGALFAVHVRVGAARSGLQNQLEENLQAARDAGAEVVLLDGDDEVCSIMAFARRERITQFFIGHSLARRRKLWFVPTTADRILRAAEGIDVKLFPH